eukprot:Hpha_TRINITY_DN16013_c1_g1::TRINITY_DN16013_c1_g1_i7::g.118755::m.118755
MSESPRRSLRQVAVDTPLPDPPPSDHEGSAPASLPPPPPERALPEGLGGVLVSEGLEEAGAVLVLIGGLNMHRAEAWTGWRRAYGGRAAGMGCGVVAMNPNAGGGGRHAEHVLAAWRRVLQTARPDARLLVAAASAGAESFLAAVAETRSAARVSAAALLDSPHRLPRQSTDGGWTCGFCTVENPREASFCSCCQQAKPSAQWACGFCAAENPGRKSHCTLCGQAKPAQETWSGELRAMLRERGRNWISGEFLTSHCREVGVPTPQPGALGGVPGLEERFGCDVVAAACTAHNEVPFRAEDEVFSFFDGLRQPATDQPAKCRIVQS